MKADSHWLPGRTQTHTHTDSQFLLFIYYYYYYYCTSHLLFCQAEVLCVVSASMLLF